MSGSEATGNGSPLGPGPALGAADGVLGFSLSVPDSWFELVVKPDQRDAAIQSLVESRIREQPELWEQRAGVVKVLREQARRAWESGAVYCACMVQPTEEGPITAAVSVSVVDGPLDASSDDPDRVTPLLQRLHTKQARDLDDTWSRPSVVEIEDVGPCARSVGVEDLALPDGAGHVRAVVMQTFVPVPGDRRVMIVSCSSPVVTLAEELLDLFDAITSTFHPVLG